MNLTYLEQLNQLISSNECFYKRKRIKVNKKKKCYYQYYNQICTCILRIRETSKYIENFNFRKENECGQAFDFYEYINCISIILTCLESLFEIIGNVELKNVMKDKSIFIVSNKSNKSDMTFFKFIRSASAVHPSETTNYNKITKHKFEVYPYAIWCDQKEFLGDKKPEGTNIELLSWNCKTNCRYKRYYLKVEEFANFANFLVEYICNLIPYANSIVEDYREKTRLKRIKKIEDFNSYSDYLVYLRNRLEKIKKSDYFADGGLLLASHIMKNPLIGNEFKQLIMKKTEQIVVKLKFDISLINHDEIFEDLILSDVLKNKFNNFSYISEKFHDYLYEETIIEIKDNSFYDFKKTENDGSNADWARSLLLSARGYLYPNGENEKAYSYADLYEITLERIFCLMKEKK